MGQECSRCFDRFAAIFGRRQNSNRNQELELGELTMPLSGETKKNSLGVSCCRRSGPPPFEVAKSSVPQSTSRLPRPFGAAGTFLRIVTVNDVYQLDNYPRVASAIKEFKAAAAANDAVVLSCLPGDFLSPCTLTNLDGGISMLRALNEVSIDYVMFGNHEFDLKTPQLQKRIQEYKGKWINSNVSFPEFVDSSGNQLPSYDVIQVGCHKVALAAFLLDDMSQFAPVEPQPKILPPTESISALWKQLGSLPGGPIDVFLPMLHLNVKEDRVVADFIAKDPSLAARTPVLLCSHDHEVYIEEAGKSLICKFGMDARNIGVIDLFWTADGSLMRNVHLFSASVFAPDEKVQLFVDKELTKMQKLLSVTITEIPDLAVNLSTAKVRFQMEPMVSFLLSVVRKAMPNVDMVVLQGGNVRGGTEEYVPGPFAYSDLMKEFAFDTQMAIVKLPGRILEESIRNTRIGEGSKPFFLHCDSDTTFATADGHIAIERINGDTFQAEKVYTVATYQFLLAGMGNIEPLSQYCKECGLCPPLEACMPIKSYFMEACMRKAWLDILGLKESELNDADTKAALDKAFDLIDTDKDGFIESNELQDYVEKSGIVSCKLVSFLIQCFDENLDGKLSREEFSHVARTS